MMNNTNAKNVEVVEVVEVVKTKKVSYRQDFLKGFAMIVDNKEEVIKATGLSEEQMTKMITYFDTQINKTKTVSTKGDYKPTEKAETILEVLVAFEGEWKTGKEIAEGSNGLLKSNGVSGSIRGLVSNGYVEATNESPKKYKITQKGVDFMNDHE